MNAVGDGVGTAHREDGRPNTSTVYIPAPDGTPLATDLHLPDTPGPHPAVVIRTPYGRTAHRAELRGWAAHGFAALAQDVRGRHGSPGPWHPYREHEEGDGTATMAWVREQAWSGGGPVVAAGASYAAHCALATALGPPGDGRPDAVIAAVPALGLAETAREPGGPERLWARAGWWAAHGDRPDSAPGALTRALAEDPRLLEHLPLTRLPDRLGRALPSWPELWDACPRGRTVLRGSTSPLPLLAVGGTRDPFAEDTMALWSGWGGPARLLLGPWGHRLTADRTEIAADRVNLGALYVRWARAALAGRLEPERRGVITLGGSGRWHGVRRGDAQGPTDSSTRTTTWPFDAPSGLRLLHGAEFTADPARPVRSDDLSVPADAAPADRCLLLSPPLPRPLDLLGPATARLHATADTPAADWAVRVTALDPAGRAEPLAFGIVRRTDPPGETVEITVPLGTLGRRLPAGTRLRTEIAGHHFPAHARNPHTGENPVTATRLAPSRRAVTARGSALHLTVVARRRYVEPVPEICR
ncbi:CocE/NonD family hydrolase [Streptomyces sp. NPDC056007]|uniref:CocE/NonD family hydrolase n=1 Tax=Streptomyces sp. NPDC056007 TaxID=3345678 RepID=UPI0035DF5669